MLNHFHGRTDKSQPAGSMAGWGKSYDTFVRLVSLGTERRIRQAALEMAGIQPGARILEVGCGTGTFTLAAKEKAGPAGQVFGIDIAADMIDIARRKAHKAGLEVQFEVGRIEAIPFPEAQFDRVLSSLMFHHIPTQAAKQQGLAEILRVLKPGGRLLIVDVEPPRSPLILGLASRLAGPDMFAHPLRDFVPLLEQAGFVEIQTGPTKSRFLSYLIGKRP